MSYTTGTWPNRKVSLRNSGATMAAWKKWLSSFPSFEPEDSALQLGIEDVRAQVLKVLDDCTGSEAERLRWRLYSASSAHDLWMLRSAIFQLVSHQHCQSEAAMRINALVPMFVELLPPGLVSRV
jgi:hypothetical protein